MHFNGFRRKRSASATFYLMGVASVKAFGGLWAFWENLPIPGVTAMETSKGQLPRFQRPPHGQFTEKMFPRLPWIVMESLTKIFLYSSFLFRKRELFYLCM